MEHTTDFRAEAVANNERGLPAQIASRIGRRILQGDLKPGSKLPRELELLDQLQVSRTTLREALTILSSKGFLEAKQRVGTRVRESEHWNTLDPMVMSWHGEADESSLILELFEMRLAVEPQAARLAAQRATHDDIKAINKALAAMGDNHGDAAKAIEADISFHLRIIEAARNRFLMPISSVIRTALTISVPKTFSRSGGMGQALAMHADIAAAIENGQPDVAEQASRILLTDTYERNFG